VWSRQNDNIDGGKLSQISLRVFGLRFSKKKNAAAWPVEIECHIARILSHTHNLEFTFPSGFRPKCLPSGLRF